MLQQLTIKNVAVIDKLYVELGSGFNVLTGETGAGKSIIIDSINMILGDRAKKELVRKGTEAAEAEAVFTANDAVRKVLEKEEIDCDDDNIIIKRKITADGKSTARINGCAVTLSALREIAGLLINIHGQHDNQALLEPNKHIVFLDSYAKTKDETEKYRLLYNECLELKSRINKLNCDESERIQRADLLAYQVNEIETANLVEDEETGLLKDREILERAEEINSASSRAYAALYDNDGGMSAYDLISEAAEAIGAIADVNERVSEVYDAVTSAMYSIEDSAREIRDFADSVEFDAEALAKIEERIDLINRLKRKYGGDLEKVIEYGKKAQKELSDIETSDTLSAELQKELDEAQERLNTAAKALTDKRRAAAKILEEEIETALVQLNMEKARFSVDVVGKNYGPDGADSVEFLISTNPGEELKPLVKIASGGELSRVMLAIKSILAKTDGVDSMIFDEIDTGVSGGAAQKIADKLKSISNSAQVICITHLPQLALAADVHFLIEKDTAGEMAKTSLEKLDYEGRVTEIARIVGGGKTGEEYARKMLENK